MTWEYDSSLWVDLGDHVREDDMNCGYCGCLLPDEYHPNCKVCGGPRKAAKDSGFADAYARLLLALTTPPPLVVCQPPVVQYYVDGEYVFTPPAVDNSLEAAWERIKEAAR